MDEQPNKPSRWTIKDLLAWTTDYFRQKGINTPRLDAEVLLAYALGVDRLHLYLNLDRPLQPEERAVFKELVRRRAAREPVALIVGHKEFWSIPFRIVPGVLIPRPETETLVEVLNKAIRGMSAVSVLEIGTGSGAIAVAVARENPHARVVATDVAARNLGNARSNATNAGVLAAVEFVAADLFSAFRPGKLFDVICSNPPYIPGTLIPQLEPEIRLWEPVLALDGGPMGLDIIQRIIRDARHFLKENGMLILEIGDDQAEAVSEILRGPGRFREVQTFSDLAGKPRIVRGVL
jgi:release factor glutamine methyltransferase